MTLSPFFERASERAGTHRAWYTSLAVLAFAIAVALTGYRVVKDFTVPGQLDPTLNGMKDFRDAVYFPVVGFLEGTSPYHDKYLEFHPEGCEFPAFSPLTFLVHLPFGLLPLPASALIYFLMLVFLTLVFSWLAVSCCSLKGRADGVFALAALILLSRPGHINLYLGQLGLQTALGTVLALQYARRSPIVSGLGLALASIKPTYFVPLALLMLCRRDYRAVLVGVAAGGLGALGATAVLIGHNSAPGTFAQGIVQQYVSLESQPAIPTISPTSGRIDTVSLATRLMGRPPTGPGKVLLFCGCLGIGCAGVLALCDTEHCERADSLSGVLIALSILTCIYHQIYDALLLVVPLLAVVLARSEPWRSLSPILRGTLIVLLALPAANYLATMTAVAVIRVPDMPWNAVMSANATVLILALIMCCVLAFRIRASHVEITVVGPTDH